ncbi:hypothetical protein FGE12_20035 [Aggregicoccus sp. 17bor-14]|uniref:hypothetical protein n=1 Tax=Myxococcaceae TaxID=31 RepID=UPI00129CE362|nr:MULTISPECIES: hypothetical protein [Myxococcaceae]MBF5044701.1 hypothetical protein [Simulacricoccus sp. 17bor-14]MRI90445.1 hypothetical protein [Aggregicoccus sp. 17bor-14]
MSFLSGALHMLDSLNPVSKLLDAAGDALGLPPEVKHALKIGAGFATGNVVMIATGAADAAEDAARHIPARTEYSPGGSGGQQSCPGYAPPAGGSRAPVGPDPQAGRLDPRVLEYRDALRTVSSNFELFDVIDGSNNDKFSYQTLGKVRDNGQVPADVRKAADFLLSHPEYLRQLDTAHRGGNPDGTISRKDLDQALRNVDKAIAEHGVREPCDAPPPCAPPPPPSGGTPSTPPPPGGTPSTPSPGTGGSGSPLDPEIHDYLSALRTLEANFPTMDGAAGSVNARLSLEDLRNMASDLRLSPELRKAAQFLSTNPGYFERLDGAGGSANDDAVDLQGVRSEIGQVQADLRKYGAPPRSGSSSGSGASSIGDIVRDPSMSIEEKVEAVLSSVLDGIDSEISRTMDDLAAAQDKAAHMKDGGNQAQESADSDVQKLSMRLQKLVEKRKAMFDLMSNMSQKFNEMANTAISNLGRA